MSNHAVLLSLHALNLVATSAILWTVADFATWPWVAKAASGGLLLASFYLSLKAARSWDWTRQ